MLQIELHKLVSIWLLWLTSPWIILSLLIISIWQPYINDYLKIYYYLTAFYIWLVQRDSQRKYWQILQMLHFLYHQLNLNVAFSLIFCIIHNYRTPLNWLLVPSQEDSIFHQIIWVKYLLLSFFWGNPSLTFLGSFELWLSMCRICSLSNS